MQEEKENAATFIASFDAPDRRALGRAFFAANSARAKGAKESANDGKKFNRDRSALGSFLKITA
jgi:hypothetical protein